MCHIFSCLGSYLIRKEICMKMIHSKQHANDVFVESSRNVKMQVPKELLPHPPPPPPTPHPDPLYVLVRLWVGR